MKSRGDWRKIIAAGRLWSKGDGWWEITLDCGHQAAVLYGATSPAGNGRCKCFYGCGEAEVAGYAQTIGGTEAGISVTDG